MRAIVKSATIVVALSVLCGCSLDSLNPNQRKAKKLREKASAVLEKGGDTNEAFTLAAEALTLDFSVASAHVVADAVSAKGFTADPVAVFEPFIYAANPGRQDTPWFHCLEALLRSERGSHLVARISKELIERNPYNIGWAGSCLGKALARLGHAREAGAVLSAALSKEPRNPSGWSMFVTMNVTLGHPEDAERAARQCLHGLPDAGPCRRAFALARYASGDIEGAAKQLEAFVDERGDDFSAWVALAIHRSRYSTDPASAIPAFERALAMRDEFPMLHCFYGDTLTKVERYEEAEEAIRKGLAIDPRSPSCLRRLGKVFAAQPTRRDEAQELYLEVVASDPENRGVKLNLARLALLNGTPMEAVPWVRSLERERHLSALRLRSLGEIQLELGKPEDAVTSFEKALRQYRDNPRLLALLEKAKQASNPDASGL